jgi:vacuolar-type H+-ATPase subunit I/STV1
MKIDHLTDKELINHVIKFDNDPVRIRLATANERTAGAIWDDLVDVGMDETYCTFTSEWGSNMHVGRYIQHLREELTIRDDELHQLREELEEQKARTIADLINELNQQITTEQYIAREARHELDKARQEAANAKEKLKMWNHLRTP